MGGNWLTLLNLGQHYKFAFISFPESQTCCNGCDRTQSHGISLTVSSRYHWTHVPGNVAVRRTLESVSEVSRGLMLWLMRGTTNISDSFRISWFSWNSNSFCHDSYLKSCTNLNIGMNIVPKLELFKGEIWKRCKEISSGSLLPRITIPSINNLSPRLLHRLQSTVEDPRKRNIVLSNDILDAPALEVSNRSYISEGDNDYVGNVIEPKTGRKFPMALTSLSCRTCDGSLVPQVLVGFGSKSVTVAKVKTLSIYAFGVYVHPNSACKELCKRHYALQTDGLQNEQDIFEDLIRQDMQMTVRLVVHYKGLKLHMVRKAFEKSLHRRLTKIKSQSNGHALTEFCEYFSEDITLSPGTTIDFCRMPGGRLRTNIGGKEIGTIDSDDLCRAFFDLYIGKSPVCIKAREDMRENIARMFERC